MKGLMKKSAAAVAALAVSVSAFTYASAFGGVTENPTPTDKNEAALYWATKVGKSWSDAPGVPAIVGDELVYTTGKELKAIDKNTGEVLDKTGTLQAASSYGITAPLYADGKIFVSEGGGIIQAFDAETFESLWVYKDELGGQSNSEITYSDGYIYTGFWKSETAEANFVCVPVEDSDPDSTDEEQSAAWVYTSAGGFYWAGAYCTDTSVVIGTDDGKSGGANVGSKILVFDKAASVSEGKAVISSEADDLTGDIRSAVSYDSDSGYFFTTSKGGLMYRFKVDGDGNITDLESLEMSGMLTSTPIAANGRIYVGVSGSSQFTEYSGHHIAVIDAESFEIVYTLETNGYPQSSALVSSSDGENYVYFTANYTPGKVYAFHDNKTMTEPEKTETVTVKGEEKQVCPTLFTPVGDQSQYCLSSLISDEEGTLYFKNDSSYMMALGSKVTALKVDGKSLYREGDSFDSDSIKVTAVLANGVEKDVTKYSEWTEITDALEAGSDEISVSYDGMLYGDTDDEIGKEYGAVYGTFEYEVLPADDYDAVEAAEQAIDAIGEVTLESGDAIADARAKYDALSDSLKAYVTNEDVLAEAEETYKALLDSTSSEDSSSENDNSSDVSDTDSDSSSEVSDSDSDSDTSSISDVSSSDGAVTDTSSAASSAAASSTGSAASSSGAADATSNPATGTAAAVSAIVVLAGAALTVSKKNK